MSAKKTKESRMRAADTLRGQASMSYVVTPLSALKVATGTNDGTWRDTWRVLSDLIDPTCHAEPVVYENLYGMEHTDLIKCSECNTLWSEPDRVRYCPNCGARRIFELDNSTEEASSTRREEDK